MSDGIRLPTNVATDDVLRLPDNLVRSVLGHRVVLDVGWMITLSRLGENKDGKLYTTCRIVKVTYEELARFVPMYLNIAEPVSSEE